MSPCGPLSGHTSEVQAGALGTQVRQDRRSDSPESVSWTEAWEGSSGRGADASGVVCWQRQGRLGVLFATFADSLGV